MMQTDWLAYYGTKDKLKKTEGKKYECNDFSTISFSFQSSESSLPVVSITCFLNKLAHNPLSVWFFVASSHFDFSV